MLKRLENFFKKATNSPYLIAGLLVLALLVRFWRMEFVPFANDGDELAFVFAGQSLIERQVPISWSSFEYPESYHYGKLTVGQEQWRTKEEFLFIKPWLDHPYFLPLIAGLISKIAGYHFPAIIPSLFLRTTTLFASLITLWLFMKLSLSLFKRETAILSFVIFAFSPSVVLGQRMFVGENFIVPLLLGVLLVLIKQRSKLYWLIPVLASLAVTIKMTGVIVLWIGLLYFLVKRQWLKSFLTLISTSFLLILLYLPYINLFGWAQFSSTILKQSTRLIGWSNPAFILSHPGFHHYLFYDLSYYLVLIFGVAGVLLIKTTKKTQAQALFWQLSALSLLVLLWSTSAETDHLGWYKLPLFTLLALNAGWFIQAIGPVKTAFTIFVAGLNNLGLVKFVNHLYPNKYLLRGSLVSLVFLPLAYFVGLREKPSKLLLTQVFIAFACLFYMAQSFYVVHNLYRSWCENTPCPVPALTSTQVIKEVLRVN